MISARSWLLVLGLAGVVIPQAQVDAPTSSELLDNLIGQVEASYAGFLLEVAADAEALARYGAMKAGLRERARGVDLDECLWLLREYVDWFGDGHLFVQEYPDFTSAELAELRKRTPRRDPAAIVSRLEKLGDRRVSLEGRWFTPNHEIAVVRNDDVAQPREFSAVILETTSPSWKPGDVLAELSKKGDGRVLATLRMDDHAPRRYEAKIVNGLFLHMPPHTWGRRAPLRSFEAGVLHEKDPRAPTFRTIGDDACVISLPSLSPAYESALRDICSEHLDNIVSRDLLIVDLRGNAGGSSLSARPLIPFYYGDEPRLPARARGRPHVLSCPATISYYASMKTGFLTPSWLRSLRRRLAEQPGRLVPLYEKERSVKERPPRRRYARPSRFAILIDGDVVSAGEAFVLAATERAKVTTYGAPTGGMIDYQNVCIVGFGRGRHRYGLGYPVIAASDRLPEGGYNKKGIPPQVPIEPGVDDKIRWVLDHQAGLK